MQRIRNTVQRYEGEETTVEGCKGLETKEQ